MPVGLGGILPSNMRYYYIKRPDWYKPKICVRYYKPNIYFSGEKQKIERILYQITCKRRADSI